MVSNKFGNLKREHVIKAIDSFNKNRELLSPHRRAIHKYKLRYKSENYPPKGIISLACEKIGITLHASDFSGGYETNKPLLNLGFTVLDENGNRLKKDTSTSQSRKSTISFSLKEIKIDKHGEKFEEGSPQKRLTNVYERNPKARQKCIAKYGTVCVICQFDFSKKYGKIGEGFIHVHHLRPVSQKIRQIDPIKDLRPVCPNCHAIIHKNKEPYTIEEVKEFRRKAKRR